MVRLRLFDVRRHRNRQDWIGIALGVLAALLAAVRARLDWKLVGQGLIRHG